MIYFKYGTVLLTFLYMNLKLLSSYIWPVRLYLVIIYHVFVADEINHSNALGMLVWVHQIDSYASTLKFPKLADVSYLRKLGVYNEIISDLIYN